DLDFDLVTTDLAPVDLIIQRAGRLHRHSRGERGMPTLVLHTPQWTEDPAPDWVSRWSAGTALVYPDHGRLWLTARLLGDGFSLPSDTRRLVEGVYGTVAMTSIPTALAKASQAAMRRQLSNALQGARNAIKTTDGYSADGFPDWDDEYA